MKTQTGDGCAMSARLVLDADVVSPDWPDKTRVPRPRKTTPMFHSTNPSLFERPNGATAVVRELTFTVGGLRDLSGLLIADDSDAARGASHGAAA
jgi:hypothetical protein